MINLKILNKNQYEAVTRLEGYTLVLAGAGTGKTRVLTFRIAYLIERGISPREIFAFTFTNKAANEMKGRLQYLGIHTEELTVSTFHSFCYSHLAFFAPYLGYQEFFTIIDEEDKLKIIKRILKENNIEMLDTEVAKMIANVKNQTMYPSKNLKESVTFNFIFHKYQEILKSYNKMDLDDLLYQFYRLLLQERYILEHFQEMCQYILVDECQDINNIQYEILLLLSKENKNLFLVGDQDQCIYAFRGSNIENINHFIHSMGSRVIKLEQNYRSNQSILEVANTLIKNNKIRLDKNLYTANTDKNFQVIRADFATDYEEVVYVISLIQKLIQMNYKYSDIAVLYRNHALSTNFEKEFIKKDIPYQVYGSYPFFRYKEIQTLIHYYQFLHNHHDSHALREIINCPPRGIGAMTLQQLELASSKEDKPLYEVMKTSTQKEVMKFVSLITCLTEELRQLHPKEFIELLLEKMQYKDYVIKLDQSKTKINRLEEFVKMIGEIEVEEEYHKSTISFINNITLDTKGENNTEEGFVKLMTIHQAKGLEFKVVIVVGCNEGILPSYKTDFKTMEEERRIFFVAITRARERLYLLSAKRRFVNGKTLYFKPSTFLENIDPNLLLVDKTI